jgi:1,4-alpha-glucan branching enzyme
MAKHNNKKNNGPANGRLRSFSYVAPKAASVQLVGDFTQWQERPISMQKGVDGTWSVSVELPPGSHPYRFLVDGQWQDDPSAAGTCPILTVARTPFAKSARPVRPVGRERCGDQGQAARASGVNKWQNNASN